MRHGGVDAAHSDRFKGKRLRAMGEHKVVELQRDLPLRHARPDEGKNMVKRLLRNALRADDLLLFPCAFDHAQGIDRLIQPSPVSSSTSGSIA